MSLILASASPRRADLLRQAGLEFTVIKPAVDEEMPDGEEPAAMVIKLARKKALDVTGCLEHGHVLAADTIVVCGGSILGKPADGEDARRMLGLLGGNVHDVYTGLVLYDVTGGDFQTGYSRTRVWMKPLEQDYINRYVESGEPLDKAGAYGIQGRGAVFIDRIEGCYFNVVGLPLSLLFELLIRMKVPTWLNRKDGGNGK